ncbi:glycosyltransferase family 2 protein [Flavobacterium sp. NST-5]|uniref:Glycosyltransferase family 2 protein n=1 Tax=Flavobacterium ichthyis TaxID=2698827 RepID=A0ABW9ZAN9_9FLAO|nr:glycosyltransferase family A protein [Flavobacterium ichthyis]NBL64834.1 glycosyltransferase family 2 protein [Flavobacterium ichthyis]
MRVGFNPNKDKIVKKSDYFHQVIVPVYIPILEGYFKDSLVILKYCLSSLIVTSHQKTYISVINNGSCPAVIEYLNSLLEKGKIQELLHTTSIGKLNSVIKGICGHRFQFVSVVDADVLFLNGWQNATYDVFRYFPKTGAVCPTPSSKSFKTHTSNIWFNLLLSKKLQFTSVRNPEALKMFANSIGNPNFYNENHLKKYLTVSNGSFKAVVGAGHFATTYLGEIFDKLQSKHSNYQLGGDSEKEILDLPVVKRDLWRLSTEDNFAHHMGNVFEPWMDEVFNSISQKDISQANLPPRFFLKSQPFNYWFKTKLFSKFILKRRVMNLLLKYKGLSKNESQNYF